ncbi:MAG: ABC transporter permease [Candidatus Rokubacteria bacterium]|nr:ABC transporter permease [Candidatus Rokubacteria bacterium]
MARVILRRLPLLALLLAGISLAAFLLTQQLPGDPAFIAAGGGEATPEMIAHARARLGLDRPVWVQYLYYMRGAVQGDFGRSMVNARPVVEDLRKFWPASVELALAAIAISAVVGIPLGVASAVRAGRWLDRLVTPGSVFLGSMPIFWLGLMAVLVFYRMLDVLPAGGRLTVGLTPPPAVTGLFLIDALLARDLAVFGDAVRHLVLPASILSVVSLTMITRVTRAAMLDILHEDYLRTARAKGLAEPVVVLKHALRNASVPILTVIGIQLGQLIGGVVITETIFSWPGLGLYAVTAVENQDYPAIIAFTLVTTVVYVLINLVVDLLYPVLNPQVRA